MGETYEVIVGAVFGGAAAGSRKYPALIVTDGYGQFETAHAAARSLVSSDAVEPMLIISVGAPVAQGGDADDRRRVYEFSPPGWPMFQEISPFHNYIIASPALAYGDGEVFRQESRWAAAHKDLPLGVFMASGTLEMADPRYESLGQIGSGPLRLAAALKQHNYPGLRLTTEILPGLGHGDGARTALVRGLRTLYAKDPGAAVR